MNRVDRYIMFSSNASHRTIFSKSRKYFSLRSVRDIAAFINKIRVTHRYFLTVDTKKDYFLNLIIIGSSSKMNVRSIGVAMFKNKRMVKEQVEWIS